MIIYKNNKWISICNEDKTDITYDKELYHVITEKNVIDIDGLKMRDFEQMGEESINNIIDTYVLNNLRH